MTSRTVTARTFTYAKDVVLVTHAHPQVQLIYAARGNMTISTREGTWVVPPQRAVWVPPWGRHEVRMNQLVHMHTLYFDPSAASDRQLCCVMAITPLLSELILEATRLDGEPEASAEFALVTELILLLLRKTKMSPLHLPEPTDDRITPITTALKENPADSRTLEDWATTVGASQRTISRLFERQTGMSFRQWQQQSRLLAALPLLANGAAVTDVALHLGYATPSAFTHMFRRSLGVPPSGYFADEDRIAGNRR